LQEKRPNLPAHLKSRGFYLQYNYNLLFYKTYRIDYSEYYFEFGNKRKAMEVGQEEGKRKTPCRYSIKPRLVDPYTTRQIIIACIYI